MNADVVLYDGEAAEPLDGEHAIIQKRDGYRFGEDAVALAKFAAKHVRRGDRVFDMCSGCGIVGIQLSIYTGCAVDGAEIDGELCDMSVRSCALNGLEGVRFYRADVNDIAEHGFGVGGYDAVVCNPPFFKVDSKPTKTAPAANSELTVTLGAVVAAAKKLLKQGGAFMLVHTCSRLDEVVCECRARGLMPKRLVVAANGKTFLLRAVLGGRPGMTVSVGE